MTIEIIEGDCRGVLRELPDQSVNMCVTSPPYFGLRDYGVDKQLGLEPTPAEFVEALVGVMREVRRVLRDDGTLWINLGDSYAGSSAVGTKRPGSGRADGVVDDRAQRNRNGIGRIEGAKQKDLIGIPWMVAFALRADGWYLRQDIIWSKPNPMPESVRDRCTKAHEYIFMLSKKPKYYYDADAIKNPPSGALLKQVAEGYAGSDTKDYAAGGAQSASGTKSRIIEKAREKLAAGGDLGSNKRSVWTVSPKPFKEAHFATFPPDLIEPCVLAGCPEEGVVLDPFFGAGTTGVVCQKHNRSCIGIELNPAYFDIAVRRLGLDQEVA